MAFSATLSGDLQSSFRRFSHFSQTSRRNPIRFRSIRAVKSAEPEKEKKTAEAKTQDSSNAQPSSPPKPAPSKLLKKPVYSSEFSFCEIFFFIIFFNEFWEFVLLFSDCLLFVCCCAVKKGQIVRVDKEKYLNSINVSRIGVLPLIAHTQIRIL